jgi:hypothetical protein
MMKIKAIALATILTLGSALSVMALVRPQTGPTSKSAQGPISTRPRPVRPMLTLQCKNPGSHQDVGKTPNITNTTNQTLAKGRDIYWKSSDGDKGVIELDAPLAPGQSISGLGAAGQSYNCTASTPK